MSWGGHLPWYPLDPDCPFLHRPFRDIVPGLHGLCRSDRLIGKYLGYFRGDKVTLDELIDNLRHWSGTKDGATVFIADDAEYCGTTGYYYVKYYGDYSRSFDIDPTAAPRLDALLRRVLEVGPMATFQEACEQGAPVEQPFYVDDRFAWHRTYADAWAGTPEARRWEPVLQELRRVYREKVQPIAEAPGRSADFAPLVEKFWFHLTNSANSDGRWPPPPNVTCAFNREWVEREIAATQATLAELEARTRGLSAPAPEAPSAAEDRDGDYGFHFTDKDPAALRSLNTYELQHAIYHYHRMADARDPGIQTAGRTMLVQVFDELDRRGMKGIRPPAIR